MKIKRALNELKKGVNFEEVAREYSEANSASMGGDIGFVDPQMKGEDYARAVYSLDEKAYTLEPIKTNQGLYIIYRDEDIPDYEWSREKIKKTLQKLKIEKLAEMKAQDIYNSLSEEKPIDLVAKEMGLKVNTSEYFTEEGTIPGLGRFPDVAIKAFQMEPGQVGNIVPIYVTSIYPEPVLTGYFVYTLKEITPAGVPQLEEIRDEVKADARRFKAITLAKRDALDIYENLSSSDLTMEIIVGQNNLIVEKVDGVSPMSGTSDMGSGYQLMRWLENAKTGEISEPLLTKKGVFIVRVDNQEEINSEDLKTQLFEIRDQLINTRSQEIYFDYYFPRRTEVEISVDMEQFLLGLSEEEAKYQQKMDELIQQKKKEKQNE
jgi:hypothetical protein